MEGRMRDLPSVPRQGPTAYLSCPFPFKCPSECREGSKAMGAASPVLRCYSELLLGKDRNKRNLSKKRDDKEKKEKAAGAGPGSHKQLFSSGSEQNH